MGGANSWRIPHTASDLIGGMNKRILHEERRPLIRSASDLLGPGLGPTAVQLLDWNDESTEFNGIFWSLAGAQNSPDPASAWMGTSFTNDDGYGYQELTEFRDAINQGEAPQQWIRTFSGAGGIRAYGTWSKVGSGTLRSVGVSIVTAGFGPTAATPVACASVTLPFPRNGRRYRATYTGYAQSDTAGGFTTTLLKHGLSATTTGTNILEMLLDHRTASRRGTVAGHGEFTYAGTDGATPYNVIAVFLGGGGNSSTIASATQPQYLSVDEIIP